MPESRSSLIDTTTPAVSTQQQRTIPVLVSAGAVIQRKVFPVLISVCSLTSPPRTPLSEVDGGKSVTRRKSSKIVFANSLPICERQTMDLTL
ncbi:hypothetical protein D6D25_03402 [Aureobasidium pullulans]|nr:hypothetical protein D6D25_03402 [Aureobasidium pullulans]